jgi:hypothetical protein
MKKLLVLLLLIAVPAMAQTVVVGQQALAWDQAATNLAEANSFAYKLYVDAAAGAAMAGVTCTGTASPFVCKASLPALTPGNHNLSLTASLAGQESAKSPTLAVQVVFIQAPQNLRVVVP